MENKKDKPILAEVKTLPDGVEVIIIGCGREAITAHMMNLIIKEKGNDILVLSMDEAKEKGIKNVFEKPEYIKPDIPILKAHEPLKDIYNNTSPIDAIMGKNKKRKKW